MDVVCTRRCSAHSGLRAAAQLQPERADASMLSSGEGLVDLRARSSNALKKQKVRACGVLRVGHFLVVERREGLREDGRSE